MLLAGRAEAQQVDLVELEVLEYSPGPLVDLGRTQLELPDHPPHPPQEWELGVGVAVASVPLTVPQMVELAEKGRDCIEVLVDFQEELRAPAAVLVGMETRLCLCDSEEQAVAAVLAGQVPPPVLADTAPSLEGQAAVAGHRRMATTPARAAMEHTGTS